MGGIVALIIMLKFFPRFEGYGDVLYLTLLFVLRMTSIRDALHRPQQTEESGVEASEIHRQVCAAPIKGYVQRITLGFDNFHRCRRHKAG